ncbi:MAG: hypothetical protein ACJATA_000382 [Sphingobacteriales bacterium]|jgi:hypothetical protein
MKYLLFAGTLALFISSCVGTDFGEEQIVTKKLQIISQFNNVTVGSRVKLESKFFDTYGYEANCEPSWISLNQDVVNITSDGFAHVVDTSSGLIVASCNGITDTVEVYVG